MNIRTRAWWSCLVLLGAPAASAESVFCGTAYFSSTTFETGASDTATALVSNALKGEVFLSYNPLARTFSLAVVMQPSEVRFELPNIAVLRNLPDDHPFKVFVGQCYAKLSGDKALAVR